MVDFGSITETLKESKKNINKNNSNKSNNFMNWKDGETHTIRFITAPEEMVIYSCHSCNANLNEMTKSIYDESVNAGKSIVCPQCGAVLTQEDIKGIRPKILPAHIHSKSSYNDNGKEYWSKYLCLNYNPYEADVDGTPKYDCPICHEKTADGKYTYPSKKGIAVAVVREKITEPYTGPTGSQMQRVTGVRTAAEDGKPKMAIINQSIYNFFTPLLQMNEKYPIQFFDFDVTRTGSSFDTRFTFTPLTDVEHPQPVDIAPMREFIPDIAGYLKSLGEPKRYVENGIEVEGFEAPQKTVEDVATIYQAAAPQISAPVIADNVFTAPADTQSWNDISNQFNN